MQLSNDYCPHALYSSIFLGCSLSKPAQACLSRCARLTTMPEGFTYHDMRRRIVAAFPDREKFSLRIYESSSRYNAVDEDAAKLNRKDGMKARHEDPSRFGSNLPATFPGLDQLPDGIRNGTVELSDMDVVSRGKAIGIPIGSDWWISIHLRLHGHLVVITAKELETLPDDITVQLALVNQDAAKLCMIVVDKSRLTTLTFVHTPTSTWWINRQGPCPITEAKAFGDNFDMLSLSDTAEDSIFKVLTKRQDFFNGIGTSHANEILHLAMEHPAQKANVILKNTERRKALKNAITRFFGFAHSDKSKRSIPAGKSGGSAFFEPHYLTRNIISMQQRVYGHTKSPTKISKADYENLFDRGLLDSKYQALDTPIRDRASRDSTYESKKVEVYAIRFLIKNRENEVRDGQYAYTVMCKTPPDCVAVRYETREKALRQALGSRAPEVGIASFVDSAAKRKSEKTAFKRRYPVREGKRGRPRKSKNHKVEAVFGAKQRPLDDTLVLKAARRNELNKNLIAITSGYSTLESGLADVSDGMDVGSSDSGYSVQDDGEGGEGGEDGEDAVSILGEAILMDEASSGEDEERDTIDI